MTSTMPLKIRADQFETVKSLLRRQDDALEKLEELDALVESAINELIVAHRPATCENPAEAA